MIVVLVTAPKGSGEALAKKILQKRLAACINITSIKSLYWWENKINSDEEDLLIIKTRKDLFEKLRTFIKEIHPYNTPEIVALKVYDVDLDYLNWLESETSLKKIREVEK